MANRHCPKCQAAAAKEWLAQREAELLPVPYFHVVFTLPAAIADIAYQNKAVIYDLLFKASSETMLTIAADPKHLGARIGILSVVHTCDGHMAVCRTRAGRGRIARVGVLGADLSNRVIGPGFRRSFRSSTSWDTRKTKILSLKSPHRRGTNEGLHRSQ